MRRGPAILLVALLTPLFAGCYEESLHVALRVPAGETLVLTGSRTVEGTLLVEEGATLVLDGADLVIEQALVVQGGTLRADASRIAFTGPYLRHDVELHGAATLRGSTLVGVRWFEALRGTILLQGGSVSASGLRVHDSALLSHDVAWSLGPPPMGEPGDFDGALVSAARGTLVVENGTLGLSTGGRALRLESGEARLSNLTLDLSRFADDALHVQDGLLHLENVEMLAPDLGRYLSVTEGTARLVDSPLPRNARYPDVGLAGRLEVAWTLTARVVDFPGNAPVPGANVTLASAHAPGGVSANATTDENGEARLIALQYVYAGGESRPGNPHLLRAESGDGRRGASPAIVMESPAVVLVPVTRAATTSATAPATSLRL